MRTYTTDLLNKPCCSGVGCNRLVVKKKMCSKHYQQVKTHGEVRPDRYNHVAKANFGPFARLNGVVII